MACLPATITTCVWPGFKSRLHKTVQLNNLKKLRLRNSLKCNMDFQKLQKYRGYSIFHTKKVLL